MPPVRALCHPVTCQVQTYFSPAATLASIRDPRARELVRLPSSLFQQAGRHETSASDVDGRDGVGKSRNASPPTRFAESAIDERSRSFGVSYRTWPE